MRSQQWQQQVQYPCSLKTDNNLSMEREGDHEVLPLAEEILSTNECWERNVNLLYECKPW